MVQIFADGNELHLRRDDALAGVGHLRDRSPPLQHCSTLGKFDARIWFIGWCDDLDIAALLNPGKANRIDPGAHVMDIACIGIWAAGVIDAEGVVPGDDRTARNRLRRGEGDLAHRYADIRARSRDVDLLRSWELVTAVFRGFASFIESSCH